METKDLLAHLDRALPGALLERQKFGRSGIDSAWVEVKSLPKVAFALRNHPTLPCRWLESIWAAQIDDSLVVSYLLAPNAGAEPLLLRLSATAAAREDEFRVPSLRHLWLAAKHWENEIAELFGAVFTAEDGSLLTSPRSLLPEGLIGYPLRKDFIFPKEVLGITHERRGNPETAMGGTGGSRTDPFGGDKPGAPHRRFH